MSAETSWSGPSHWNSGYSSIFEVRKHRGGKLHACLL